MQSRQIGFLELLDGTVQYVVPPWHRRHCWGRTEIERLIDDLLNAGRAGGGAAHIGAIMTFPGPEPPGVVRTIRVVDGQQRLTTVSILLACIAKKLGPEGAHGEWTARAIRDGLLTNPGEPPAKHRKLRLQEGDEDEYRRGLEGRPRGGGAVTTAWKTVHRIVGRSDDDVGQLLEGLRRLRVVDIRLDEHEDPQQIFESLNVAGQPLTESEKVKNWLLMGLPESEQQDLHNDCWLVMERALGAEPGSNTTEKFLRDHLRCLTGETTAGIDDVHEHLHRWLVQHGENAGDVEDRAALCRELPHQARLHGILTGRAEHMDPDVERELRHLRAMGIRRHFRGHFLLCLRLLHDASSDDSAMTNDQLAKILAGIAAWVTRWWLAGRPTNRKEQALAELAELAHDQGPSSDEDCVEYWLGCISRLRNTQIGVPSDEKVKQGIRTRNAYDGSGAKQSCHAVLCALMEAEQREESPAREGLEVEHVMPRTLTDEWKRALCEEADDVHEQHCHCLANLTLISEAANRKLGNAAFEKKCEEYRKSPIGLTNRIAEETEWNPQALSRRAEELARRALELWPWSEQAVVRTEGPEVERPLANRTTGKRLARRLSRVAPHQCGWRLYADSQGKRLARRFSRVAPPKHGRPPADEGTANRSTGRRSTGNAGLRWRIENGPWHAEDTASQMVRNVAGALLSLDRRNAERLAGKAIRPNIHPASRYPAGSKVGGSTMQAVPGHEDHVLYSNAAHHPASARRCREMGERCGVRVDVDGVEEVNRRQLFFRFLQTHGAAFPGQTDDWRGPYQWTSPTNSHGDRIRIFFGEEALRLYVRPGLGKASEEDTSRMRHYSRKLKSDMADQQIVGNPLEESHEGRSVSVQRRWTLEDEDEWPDAADWLQEQTRRLQIILADPGRAGRQERPSPG